MALVREPPYALLKPWRLGALLAGRCGDLVIHIGARLDHSRHLLFATSLYLSWHAFIGRHKLGLTDLTLYLVVGQLAHKPHIVIVVNPVHVLLADEADGISGGRYSSLRCHVDLMLGDGVRVGGEPAMSVHFGIAEGVVELREVGALRPVCGQHHPLHDLVVR